MPKAFAILVAKYGNKDKNLFLSLFPFYYSLLRVNLYASLINNIALKKDFDLQSVQQKKPASVNAGF